MTTKTKKVKPCRLCPGLRYGPSSWCYKHYRDREKKKREEKKEKSILRKKSTKKYQISETRKLHKKCWTLQSIIVRSSAADKYGFCECYTCGKTLPWKEMHAGHYRHGTLDFDRRNLKPQCTQCNTYNGGKLNKYTLKLIKEYGIEWVEMLERDADRHPGYRLEELQKIYEVLKTRI